VLSACRILVFTECIVVFGQLTLAALGGLWDEPQPDAENYDEDEH